MTERPVEEEDGAVSGAGPMIAPSSSSAAPSGIGHGTAKKRRWWISMLAAMIAGALLAVTHAPLWIGCVVATLLAAVLVPWISLGGRRGR